MSAELETPNADDAAFTDAFDQFTAPGEAPPAGEREVPAAGEGEAPAAGEGEASAAGEGDTPPAGEGEGEGEVDGEQAPPSDAAGDAGDAPDISPEDAGDDDLMQRLATLLHKTQPTKPAAEPAQPVEPTKPAAEAPPLYTDEEQQLIAKYEEDWPEVARAEALRRRGEYQQIVEYVFTEVAKTFAPMMQSTETMAAMHHLQQLQQLVPDYDDVRDQVIEWAGSQPAYLKSAYDRVIQQGTPDEVADLIERYRADTGRRSTPAAPAAPARTTELSAQAKKAASALAPVSSKRSAVSSALDPLDFDNAFATFASKL